MTEVGPAWASLMLRLSGGCALPVKGCHLGSKTELNQGLGGTKRERGALLRQLSACVSPSYSQEQLCPGPACVPVGKPAQNSQEEKVTPVISEKQLDPLAERDGLCSFS